MTADATPFWATPEGHAYFNAEQNPPWATIPHFDQALQNLGYTSIGGTWFPPPNPTNTGMISAGLTSSQQSARAIINSALSEFGLGQLGDTAWGWFLADHPIEQIMLDIRQTPAYKARFPAMETLAKEGRAITEQQYINYEQQASNMWHAAGLPPSMLQDGDYVTKWLEGDVSMNELTHRMQDLYVRVANTAPEVRDWFNNKFANGTGALAAAYADPNTAVTALERETAASEFGGAGTRFGYNIDLQTALRAADVGVTASQAQSGFQQVQQLNPLFNETVSENTDLTAEQQGVQAVFGFGEDARRAIMQRLGQRQAEFGGSTEAGGVRTQQGFGLGVAPTSG